MASTRLYVGNLTYSVTTEQLQALFGDFGQIKDVTVINGKGFGFVEFADSADAATAREALNGKDFQGRVMRVDEARPQNKPERSDRGGGGGRRSNR